MQSGRHRRSVLENFGVNFEARMMFPRAALAADLECRSLRNNLERDENGPETGRERKAT